MKSVNLLSSCQTKRRCRSSMIQWAFGSLANHERTPMNHLNQFVDLLQRRDCSGLVELLASLPPGEGKRLVSRLEIHSQAELFALLPLADAALLIQELLIPQAAEVLL